MTLPSLSVVIPVYNEPDWIVRTLDDLLTAVERSPFDEVDIVVVDDGSGPETVAALDALEARARIRVLRQANSGRYLARKAGIEAASGELVLMLDSRVSLDAGALAWVAPHVAEGRRVWNGHCIIDTSESPYARFWDVITRATFADYLDNPRTTSFGLEEYDRFPKGTTHFLAPRQYLIDAMAEFASRYDDMHFVSDDTHLLRFVAARERINISPEFGSLYRSRTALRPFLKQAAYRGTTFVDTWRPGTRFFPLLVAFYPASIASLVIALRRPRLAVAGAAGVPVAAAAIARVRWKSTWMETIPFATLAGPFGVYFVAGVWRGAFKAVWAKLGR